MHDLPDFDTIVEYVKTGLKRKTSLDQIRGVLSSNNISMVTINKAVVVAIEQLDQERTSGDKVVIEDMPVAPQVTIHADEKQGYKLAAILIFVCLVVGTVFVAPLFALNKDDQATVDNSVSRIGLAIRSMFLNKDYVDCCKESLSDLSAKDQFEVCRIGSDYYDDYEVFRAANSKESLAKILNVVQEKCAMLSENLKSICSEKSQGILDKCYTKKAKSNNYLLSGVERQ